MRAPARVPLFVVWLSQVLTLPSAHASLVQGEQEWAFASGLKVVHVQDPRFPVSRVVVAIGAGTADSPTDRKQLAHLVEHLWFRTDAGGMSVGHRLDAMGCTYNAHTRYDTTVFESQCPSVHAAEHLRTLLGVFHADFAALPASVVDTEKRVVVQEARLALDDGSRPILGAASRGLFPDDHPYHEPASAEAAVAACTADDAAAFAAAHYHVAGAVVVVGGDVDTPTFARALARAMPPTDLHPDLTAAHAVDLPADAVRFLGVTDDAPFPWYIDPARPEAPLGFAPADPPPINAVFAPRFPVANDLDLDLPLEDAVLAVAWTIPSTDPRTYWPTQRLGTFATTDVRSALRTAKGVLDVRCTTDPGRLASILLCRVRHEDDADVADLTERVTAAFTVPYDLHREQRLRAAYDVEDLSGQRVAEFDHGGLETAIRIALHRMMSGVTSYYTARYDVVTSLDLVRYLQVTGNYLQVERAVVVRVHPTVDDDLATADALGRYDDDAPAEAGVDVLPPTGPVSPVLDGRREQRLANGLSVVRVPVNGLATTYWSVVFPTPPGFPDELPYLVDGQFSAPRRWEGDLVRYRLPAPSPGTHGAASVFRVRGQMEPADIAAALRATFESHRLHKPGPGVIQDRKLRILRSWLQTSYWRNHLVHEAFTGAPLGPLPSDVQAAAAVSGKTLAAYQRAKFRPDNAAVLVVGRVDDRTLDRAVDGDLSTWSADEGAVPSHTDPIRVWQPDPVAWVLDEPRSTQVATLSVTCPLDLSDVDDATASGRIRVLERLLYQRVWSRLREQAGAVYTPTVTTRLRWQGAELGFSASTTTADLPGLVTGLRSALATIRAGEVDAGALALARRQAFDALTVGLDSDLAVASFLSDRWLIDRDTHFATDLADTLAATDPATLARMLAPCAGHEVVIASGDAAAVTAALAEVGLDAHTFDWQEALLERVKTWFPARYEAVRKRL
ncbi:MAG: insulinase family protein [Alphaproteobacteria bacterium]|nr:insulinase family protein [Alphaproteobacteria bacterium]